MSMNQSSVQYPSARKALISSCLLSPALFWKMKLSSEALKVALQKREDLSRAEESGTTAHPRCAATPHSPGSPTSRPSELCQRVFCDQEPTARNERTDTLSLLVNTTRRLEGPFQKERVKAQMEKDHRISRGEKLQAKLCSFDCWFLGLLGFC